MSESNLENINKVDLEEIDKSELIATLLNTLEYMSILLECEDETLEIKEEICRTHYESKKKFRLLYETN